MNKLKCKYLKFALFLFAHVSIFFLVQCLFYVIFYKKLGVDSTKLLQFIFWLTGFGFGLFLIFIPYVKERVYLMISLSVAVVYVISFFIISEIEDNNFIDVTQNFVFIIEFILLPFTIKEVLHNKLPDNKCENCVQQLNIN